MTFGFLNRLKYNFHHHDTGFVMSTLQFQLWDQKIGEPGLLIQYQGEIILFDTPFCLFDRTIKTSTLHNTKAIFLTHRHRDHFGGIDRLFFEVSPFPYIVGNSGTLEAVHQRLQSYDINLIAADIIEGRDVHAEQIPITVFSTNTYQVEAVSLHHGNIESIAYAFSEKPKIKLDKKKLALLGYSSGSWVREAKEALESREIPSTIVIEKNSIPFEDISPLFFEQAGKKIVYASDFSISESNTKRLEILAKDADHFFCEAAYLSEDRDLAIKNHHQTVEEVAGIAKRANVSSLHLFHHSRRYQRYHKAEETFLQQAAQIFPNVE